MVSRGTAVGRRAGFVGIAIARSVQVGIPFRDPGGAFLVSRVLLTLWIFLGLLVLDGLIRTGRPWNVRRVWATLRRRWPLGRLALAWAALLAYNLTYFIYHNLKSWDVFNSPRDAMLTDWDRWLFLGHTPAVLLSRGVRPTGRGVGADGLVRDVPGSGGSRVPRRCRDGQADA